MLEAGLSLYGLLMYAGGSLTDSDHHKMIGIMCVISSIVILGIKKKK